MNHKATMHGAEQNITEHLLSERFGLPSLRPIQGGVIARLLGSHDQDQANALVVLPTGSGKSLCYQLPALALRERDPKGGVGLVFSPLIALMEDQVAALKQRGVRAEYINSTLSRKEREKRYARLAKGDYELIYATPERMAIEGFTEALNSVPGGVRLLAVDEADCISRWGHDLRPAYAEVGAFREQLGSPPTVALTATATRAVRDDIRAVLGLSEAQMPLFASGIDRPNLALSAKTVFGDDDKLREIASIARTMGGVGIVYFSLIKDLERFHELLRNELPAFDHAIYHGKLDPGRKKAVYARFMRASKDDPLVLCATNAFGMGVDKPDLRFIVHAQTPGSVEAYFQEVGRAGRDGEPSACRLLFMQDDLAIQHEFIEWSNPSPDLLASIMSNVEHRYAGDAGGHATFDADDIRLDVIGKGHAHGKSGGRVEYALIALEKAGFIERADTPGSYQLACPFDDSEVDPQEAAEKRKRDLTRLLEVINMSRSDDIAAFVRNYFDIED